MCLVKTPTGFRFAAGAAGAAAGSPAVFSGASPAVWVCGSAAAAAGSPAVSAPPSLGLTALTLYTMSAPSATSMNTDMVRMVVSRFMPSQFPSPR